MKATFNLDCVLTLEAENILEGIVLQKWYDESAPYKKNLIAITEPVGGYKTTNKTDEKN